MKFGNSVVKIFPITKTIFDDDCQNVKSTGDIKLFLYLGTLGINFAHSFCICKLFVIILWMVLFSTSNVCATKRTLKWGPSLNVLSHASHFRWRWSLMPVQSTLHQWSLHGNQKWPCTTDWYTWHSDKQSPPKAIVITGKVFTADLSNFTQNLMIILYSNERCIAVSIWDVNEFHGKDYTYSLDGQKWLSYCTLNAGFPLNRFHLVRGRCDV